MRGVGFPTTLSLAEPSHGSGSLAGTARCFATSAPGRPVWNVRSAPFGCSFLALRASVSAVPPPPGLSLPGPLRGAAPAAGGKSPCAGGIAAAPVVAAASAASNTFGYVPHRQVFPATAAL